MKLKIRTRVHYSYGDKLKDGRVFESRKGRIGVMEDDGSVQYIKASDIVRVIG